MNWLNYMDKKQTKISPEILDVDSSRKPISLDGKKKKSHKNTGYFFLKLQSVFIFCLYCFFFFISIHMNCNSMIFSRHHTIAIDKLSLQCRQ